MVPNARSHHNRRLAVGMVLGALVLCACGPTPLKPAALPRQQARLSWWPRVADPNAPETWVKRYLDAQGSGRSVWLRRKEALANLVRLSMRVRRETKSGSPARLLQREQFRKQVVPPMVAALPRRGYDFLSALIRIAPADRRVVQVVSELTGYLGRPAPKRLAAGKESVSVLNSVLLTMARAASTSAERVRLLGVLDKLVAVLCPGGKRNWTIQGNTNGLLKEVKKSAKVLEKGPTLGRSWKVVEVLNKCR